MRSACRSASSCRNRTAQCLSLSRVLAGRPQALLSAASKPPLRPVDAPASPELWVEPVADMATSWLGLIASELTYQPAELQVR